MRTFIAIVAASGAVALGGCQQIIARRWGGHMQIDLPACRKFEAADWKESHLWYVTRPMRPSEQPETHRYEASTAFGILQGSVDFVEHPCTGDVPQ